MLHRQSLPEIIKTVIARNEAICENEITSLKKSFVMTKIIIQY